MTTKHTPGPWIVNGGGHPSETAYPIITNGRGKVADVVKREDGAGEANYRLIAAAPELLEALKEAEISATGALNVYSDALASKLNTGRMPMAATLSTMEAELQSIREVVRAAIAKAEGAQ
jgi:hypothetical protein